MQTMLTPVLCGYGTHLIKTDASVRTATLVHLTGNSTTALCEDYSATENTQGSTLPVPPGAASQRGSSLRDYLYTALSFEAYISSISP